MKLIIIQGAGASGKSTLANKLSKDLNIPTFLKDDYKEGKYALTNGKLNLAEWLRLEGQSYDEINRAIEAAIRDKKSLIVEGNFPFFRVGKLKQSVKPYTNAIEIVCYARPWITFKRFIQRAERADRHKGHWDRFWYPLVFLDSLSAQFGLRWYKPMHLSNNLMEVDTSNPNKIDHQAILKFINKA